MIKGLYDSCILTRPAQRWLMWVLLTCPGPVHHLSRDNVTLYDLVSSCVSSLSAAVLSCCCSQETLASFLPSPPFSLLSCWKLLYISDSAYLIGHTCHVTQLMMFSGRSHDSLLVRDMNSDLPCASEQMFWASVPSRCSLSSHDDSFAHAVYRAIYLWFAYFHLCRLR